MMPVITISFLFNEQVRLILRTSPRESELACPVQPFDDVPDGFGFKIRAANLPRSPRGNLLALQQTGFH